MKNFWLGGWYIHLIPGDRGKQIFLTLQLLVQGQSIQQVQGQSSLGREGIRKQNAGDNVIEQGAIFQLQQAADFYNFNHVPLALESRIEETTWTVDAGQLELNISGDQNESRITEVKSFWKCFL